MSWMDLLAIVPGARAAATLGRARGHVQGASAIRQGHSATAVPARLLSGPRDVYVYYGYNASGQRVYVGITNNIPRRQRQHGERFDIRAASEETFTRDQARILEQAIIERSPHFQNIRNSVAPGSALYNEAIGWARAYLTQIGM